MKQFKILTAALAIAMSFAGSVQAVQRWPDHRCRCRGRPREPRQEAHCVPRRRRVCCAKRTTACGRRRLHRLNSLCDFTANHTFKNCHCCLCSIAVVVMSRRPVGLVESQPKWLRLGHRCRYCRQERGG